MNNSTKFYQRPVFYLGISLVLVVSGLCYGVSQYYFKQGFHNGYIDGHEDGFNEFESNLIEKHQKRVNKKYNLRLNEEEFIQAVNLIESGNTQEFENQIFKIHEGIIDEVSSTMELSSDERQKLKNNLQVSNADIAKEYIEAYVESIKPLENSLKEDRVLNFTTATKVEKATAAIAAHICAFSTSIFSPMKIRLNDAQDYAAGFLLEEPCAMLISGFLNPLSAKLVQAGVIKDFAINKSRVEQNYSKMIAELATAEVSYTTTKTNKKGTEFFGGLFKSSGTITYQFVSVIKAGFDLSERLEVSFDHTNKVVNVIIPDPKIFDPIISTQILEFDDQDLIKDLDLNDLNAPLNAIRQECINYAELSNIKERAIVNAKFILSNLFSPAVGRGYGIEIRVGGDFVTK